MGVGWVRGEDLTSGRTGGGWGRAGERWRSDPRRTGGRRGRAGERWGSVLGRRTRGWGWAGKRRGSTLGRRVGDGVGRVRGVDLTRGGRVTGGRTWPTPSTASTTPLSSRSTSRPSSTASVCRRRRLRGRPGTSSPRRRPRGRPTSHSPPCVRHPPSLAHTRPYPDTGVGAVRERPGSRVDEELVVPVRDLLDQR